MKGTVWDYVSPMDIEAYSKSFEAAKPFRFILVDNFLRPDFAHEVCQAYPSYEAARQLSEREFKAVNEYRKVQITSTSAFPEPVRTLSEALSSQELRDTLTEITGISDLLADPEFRGGGMHLMETGSRLDLHVDFNHLEQKLYRRHTGYPGGLKSISAERMIAEHPTRLIEFSVKGMLPKGPLGRQMGRKLKAYAGPEHPHAAQKPEKVDISAIAGQGAK